MATKAGASSLDIVNDFNAAGKDVIDLSGIDANALIEGMQAFSFSGKATTNDPGSIWWKSYGNINAAEKALGIEIDGIEGVAADNGPVSVIFGNTSGDHLPEFLIVLLNTSQVTVSDFYFG